MDQMGFIGEDFVWDTSENSIRVLVESGIDSNRFDKNQLTALMLSSALGYLDLVKFLVENRADINLKNNSGRCALHWACLNGQIEIVKFLIQKGCELNAGDSDEMTALHFASENGNINVKDMLGCINFHYAAQHGHKKCGIFYQKRGRFE